MSSMGMSPEADYRRAFEARPPALGLAAAQISELEPHPAHPQLLPTHRRSLFRMAQSPMLRSLISTWGCSTLADLCGVLRAEFQSGSPAPVPEWYVFSTTTSGPKKTWYDACDHRGCANTETTAASFQSSAIAVARATAAASARRPTGRRL
jgi:hypothetical protein